MYYQNKWIVMTQPHNKASTYVHALIINNSINAFLVAW